MSRVSNCINHVLLTPKLNACRFNLPVLHLVHEYLSNRNTVRKVSKYGVSFWSVFGHFSKSESKGPIFNKYSNLIEIFDQSCAKFSTRFKLFSLPLADVVFILNDTDLANYTGDNNPYTVAYTVESL